MIARFWLTTFLSAGLVTVPLALAAQDMGGIVVDRPIPRGECGVGTRGGDRFMICRDANGALRNEGVIRDRGPANAGTPPSAPAPSVGPQAVPRHAAPAQGPDRRFAALPIDRTTRRFGDVVVNGCESLYRWLDGFDADGFNARRPGTAIYDGSEFRLASFMSDEVTKRAFGLELSAWTQAQMTAFYEHSRACANQADNLAYNPESEPTLRPHAQTIRSFAERLRVLHNYLDSAFGLVLTRQAVIEQLRQRMTLLRAEPLDAPSLLALLAVRDAQGLPTLAGFGPSQRLDQEGREGVYREFVAVRDARIEPAIADVRAAVAAAAAAPVTVESFGALTQAIGRNAFFGAAARAAPDNPKIAPVLAQLRSVADQIRDRMMRDFDAKVAAAPMTVAGADAIRQAALDIQVMGIQLTPESHAKGEERYRAAYRAGILAAERAIQAIDVRSYREFGKIDAVFEAHFPAVDVVDTRPVFVLGPVRDDFDRLMATMAALRRRAAETHFQAFARDLTAVPNTEAGKARIEKEFVPVAALLPGAPGEPFRRAIEVKLGAVEEGVRTEACADELRQNGISKSEGERMIVGPRGPLTFAEFACAARDVRVRVSDVSIPNLVTGLFSSKITFRISPRSDLPFTVEAEERDLDGRKAIVGVRAIQDVSMRTVTLSLDEWRRIVREPEIAHEIFGR